MKIAQVSGLGAVWGSYRPDVLTSRTSTVGGGEAAMLQTSFALARRGHEVTCFYPGEEYVSDGSSLHLPPAGGRPYGGAYVHFRPLADAPAAILTEDFHALVSWSDHNIIRMAPSRMIRAFSQQLNDMPADPVFWQKVDVVISPSMTHARFLEHYKPPEASCVFAILGAGVDPKRYLAQRPFAERANVVSWWSSPDRGLHNLLLMWPSIRARVPDAELRIFYHLDRFIDGTRNHLIELPDLPWRARLLEALTSPPAPGVKILGAIPREELAKHQMETKVWAFPFEPAVFTEGFAVSALEALAAGTWPIARPDDAIYELYGRAVQWIHGGVIDPDYRAAFADAIVTALQAKTNAYAEAGKEVVSQFTWDNSAIQIERALRVPVRR